MTIYEQIKSLWSTQTKEKTRKWLSGFQKNIERVEQSGATFNEWDPLRLYLSLGKAGSASPAQFSVRFQGQEVATIKVKNQQPYLVVTEEDRRTNRKYFDVTTDGFSETPWRSSHARDFRKAFLNAVVKKPRSAEHQIEARMLAEMEKTSGKMKFGGSEIGLSGIRHVGLTKFHYPFQFPVPFSAHSGVPINKTGYIDILARRRSGSTKLSVWEIKQPKVSKNAVAQSYIYAVCLALILRERDGLQWYRLMGFKGPLPKILKIEAVSVVTEDQQPKVRRAAHKLIADGNPMKLENEHAEIHLKAAYYDPETLKLELEDLAALSSTGGPK